MFGNYIDNYIGNYITIMMVTIVLVRSLKRITWDVLSRVLRFYDPRSKVGLVQTVLHPEMWNGKGAFSGSCG